MGRGGLSEGKISTCEALAWDWVATVGGERLLEVGIVGEEGAAPIMLGYRPQLLRIPWNSLEYSQKAGTVENGRFGLLGGDGESLGHSERVGEVHMP